MKKKYVFGVFSTLFAALLILSSCTLPFQQEPAEVAPVNIVDFSDIHYDMTATIDMDNHQVQATQTTTFTSDLQQELDTIGFNLYANAYKSKDTRPGMGYSEITEKDAYGDIVIQEVQVDGTAVTTFSTADQFLKIPLPTALEPGKTIAVTLTFKTTIPTSTDRFGCYDDTCSITQWHPLLAKYDEDAQKWNDANYALQGESDFVNDASFTATLTYPKKYTAVTGGVDTVTEKDSTNTLTANLEHGRIFAVIISEYFEIESHTFGDTTIRAVRDKRTTDFTKDDLTNLFTDAQNAITFYSDKLGEFAYKKQFDIVETAVEGFAMEYSGLVQMGNFFNGAPEYRYYDIVAHEIGHQWMYSKIGSNSALDPFIDEGFTSFITAYYYNEMYPNDREAQSIGLDDGLASYYNGERIKGPIGSDMTYFDSKSPYTYSEAVYDGTALLLNELRLLDSKKLDGLLADIADSYSYKLIGRDDVYELVAKNFDDATSAQFKKIIDAAIYKYPTIIKPTDI